MSLAALIRDAGDGLSVRQDVPAERLTTMAVGGAAQCLVEVSNPIALRELLQLITKEGLGVRVLGRGSNVVFSDDGISGVVLSFSREFARFYPVSEAASAGVEPHEIVAEDPTEAGEYIWAYAGAPLMTMSRTLSAKGLSGLEFAAGIPGSLGGAVKMNAGAHHSSMSEIVSRVVLVSPRGDLQIVEGEALEFSYRHSVIPRGSFVLGALLKLTQEDPEEIQARRASCLDYRKRTQPLHLPSSGSVFRNPSRYVQELNETGSSSFSAASLIEQVGLKGKKLGGVMISDLHANWIVKVEESARADDVRQLISLAQDRVFQQFGETLQPELIFWERDDERAKEQCGENYGEPHEVR